MTLSSATPAAPEADLDELLVRLLGPGATFREGQRQAVEAVLAGRRTLVVQRTGWGKSLVYWLATRVLRDRGQGTTLVISPLLSLMRDQLRAADRLGLRAVTINSGNVEEWDRAEAAIANDEVDVLMISPERLSNERFGQLQLTEGETLVVRPKRLHVFVETAPR